MSKMHILKDKDINGADKKIKKKKRRYRNDKILDNKYNQGDLEYTQFSEPEIERDFKNSRLTQYYDSYEYQRLDILYELIDKIYTGTVWSKTYGIDRKVPKQELSEIFEYIQVLLKKEDDADTFTAIELFIAISNYLDVNPKILLEMISPAFKIELLDELRAAGYEKLIEKHFPKLF